MAASSQESTTRAFAAFAFLLPDGSSDDDGYDDSDDETLPRDQGPRRPRRSDVRGLEAWRVGWRGAPAVKYLGTLTERLAQEHLRLFGVSQDVFRCFLDKIRDGYAAGAHDFGWDGDRQVVVAWAAANGISLDLGTATDVNKSAVVEAARAAGCPWDARKLVDDTAPREADSRPRPPPIPLSLKVMGVLKAVVSGESMLSAGLFVGVSESTLSALFLKVIAFVSTSATLYGDYVRYPTTHDELTLAEEPFRRVGYPGCVAPSDGVHFLWNQVRGRRASLRAADPTLLTTTHSLSTLRRRPLGSGGGTSARPACLPSSPTSRCRRRGASSTSAAFSRGRSMTRR